MPTNESLANVLDKAWEGKSLKEIVKASPAVLQGVTDADAAKLKEAFGIDTVEELAHCKFIKQALALVTLAEYEK